MGYKKKFAILCLVIKFSLIAHSGFSQTIDYSEIDKRAKNAPIGISKFYKPLAHYLADKYTTDEEKVRSISVWIINNIRYDTKVLINDKREKHSPNKILRRKKAICQGYCDLFEAMCNEVGITSVTITGYDKGAFYAPADIFIKDDHAWSAVQLNDGWHLIDLTWCAGSLSPKKQLFRRILYYTFKIPFKQKYRFKANENYKYYFTDPELFSKDHLPTYPWWQLKDKETSIEYFEKDSSNLYSYRVKKSDNGGVNISPPDFEKDESPDSYLKRGKAAHEFNSKNFLTLASNKATACYEWYNKTGKDKSLEPKLQKEIYDSCLILLNEAIGDSKIQLKYISNEKIIKNENNKHYMNKNISFLKTQININKKQIRENEKLCNQIDSRIDNYKKKKEQLYRNITSSNNEKINKTLEDSEFKLLNDSLGLLIPKLSPNNLSSDSINTFSKAVSKNISFTEDIVYNKIILRYYFNWYLLPFIDSLNQVQDSIKKDDLKQFNNFYSSTYQLFNDDAEQLELSNAILQVKHILIALNTKNIEVTDSLKNEYKAFNRKRINYYDDEISKLRSLKQSLKKLNKQMEQENLYIRFEKKFERKRYGLYNHWHIKHKLRESKNTVELMSNIRLLKKEIRKKISECNKKIKEEEKLEKMENK